jgi:dipeptidyl aminopeptidase/acylaminoacyl peptidase
MSRHVETRSAFGALLAVSLFLVGLPATATVSGENGKIAFVSDRDGNPEIYVMEADGSEVTLLTSGEDPAWSPDGTRIALSRDGAIFIRSLSGGETRITDPSTATHPTWARTFLDRYPAWSPDGSSIAFKKRLIRRDSDSKLCPATRHRCDHPSHPNSAALVQLESPPPRLVTRREAHRDRGDRHS